jgi:glycine cleavage system H protein
VESVKAASDVYAPLSGTVKEINTVLSSQPDLVNQSPEDKGWFVKLEVSDPSETKSLMDAAAYKKHAEASADHH